MADTLAPITLDENWVDLYAATGITLGKQLSIQVIGGYPASLAISLDEPTNDVRGWNFYPYTLRNIGLNSDGVWARTSPNTKSTLIQVGEAGDIGDPSGDPNLDSFERTAFGELSVAQPSPVTQISAQYGLLSNLLTVVDDDSSGSTTVSNEKYICQTGLSADGLASILTFRQLAYRAGQGALARFTALFTVGVADSSQAAGLITAENLLAFGYIGANFGIIFSRDGHDELQELTLTVAAGVENATVTINGIPYIVPLSGFGTVQGDAYEIAISLSAQVPNYSFTSNNDQVVAQAVISSPQAAFAYSSAGTSVGSWVQLLAGTAGITSFVPQSQWNHDTRMEGTTLQILNPTLGNVYQIRFQYLGFGAIDFSIEDADTGRLKLVHRIKFANSSTTTSMNNPTFRVGWICRNSGNTTNITTSGGSAGAFIEGSSFRDTPPRSVSNDQLGISSTLTNIFSLRNRITFGDKVNRAEIFLIALTASTQTTKFAFFKIIVGATFGSDVVWSYEDKIGSIAEITLDNATVSGGREIGTVTVVAESPSETRFNITLETATFITPGDVITIAAVVPQGAAADCQAALTWQEDL